MPYVLSGGKPRAPHVVIRRGFTQPVRFSARRVRQWAVSRIEGAKNGARTARSTRDFDSSVLCRAEVEQIDQFIEHIHSGTGGRCDKLVLACSRFFAFGFHGAHFPLGCASRLATIRIVAGCHTSPR